MRLTGFPWIFLVPFAATACAGAVTNTETVGGSKGPVMGRAEPKPHAELLLALKSMSALDLWPGFRPAEIPVAFHDGLSTYLVQHPKPPDNFTRLASGVWHYEGKHPAVSANSYAEIGGVLTATATLPLESSPSDQAALLLHETFHVYQRNIHPDWAANEASLFAYPFDDTAGIVDRLLETQALSRALDESVSTKACWSLVALEIRKRRFERLGKEFSEYEQKNELNEGLARYVEHRALKRADEIGFPKVEFAANEVRARGYVTGHALAALLDVLAPKWHNALDNKRSSLDELLSEALADTSATGCSLSENDRRVARKKASQLVEKFHTENHAALNAALSRKGWKVTVAAAKTPLFPEGFDPLNVRRVSDSQIVHMRWLKLKNEHGQLEVSGVASVTQAAGSHPLFNGIQKFDFVLASRPVVIRNGSTVLLKGAGFTAEFSKAQLIWDKQTLLIKPGES